MSAGLVSPRPDGIAALGSYPEKSPPAAPAEPQIVLSQGKVQAGSPGVFIRLTLPSAASSPLSELAGLKTHREPHPKTAISPPPALTAAGAQGPVQASTSRVCAGFGGDERWAGRAPRTRAVSLFTSQKNLGREGLLEVT